jgi:predicted phosphodiesterase
MENDMGALKRRSLLGFFAAAAIMLVAVWTAAPKPVAEPVAFFLIGDTHLLANKKDPAKVDDRSAALSAGLVDALNKLAGTEIPNTAGGGKVLTPRGVIHAGDCIDTGDQVNPKMQATEWAAFITDFGLTGKDGKLKLPIYEVHGNHDDPRGDGMVAASIAERNKSRPGVTNVSKNGLHYSWDWGNVHFINLGIVVGQVEDVKRKRKYGPQGSLEFLVSDLKDKVGASGRPVVVTHHVDMMRYAQPLPVDDKKAEGMEWDPADVKAYYDALQGYNVAAILYGHTHMRNVFRWNGSTKKGDAGIPVFNVTKSSHYSSKQQGFFYVEISDTMVTVREYQTKDSWQSGSWAPQTWTAAVAKAVK